MKSILQKGEERGLAEWRSLSKVEMETQTPSGVVSAPGIPPPPPAN
jgi:hypothetical protein